MRYAVSDEGVHGASAGTRKLVALAAGFEAAVGLVLIAAPELAVPLVFGASLGTAGAMLARITGFSLLGLGFACWPEETAANPNAVRGLECYNVLAAVLLLYLGLQHQFAGPLLWPAFIAHAILSLSLARVLLAARS